jgi:hypothetical protein
MNVEARDDICFTCEARVATHTVRVCGVCIGESTEEDFRPVPAIDLPPIELQARHDLDLQSPDRDCSCGWRASEEERATVAGASAAWQRHVQD